MLAVLEIFFVVALVALGSIGLLKTRGRARALVGGGVGVLILTRLVGPLASVILNAVGGGRASVYAGQIAINAIIGLLTLVGVGLLIGAAVVAGRSAVPSSTAFTAPGQPGDPGRAPAGWR